MPNRGKRSKWASLKDWEKAKQAENTTEEEVFLSPSESLDQSTSTDFDSSPEVLTGKRHRRQAQQFRPPSAAELEDPQPSSPKMAFSSADKKWISDLFDKQQCMFDNRLDNLEKKLDSKFNDQLQKVNSRVDTIEGNVDTMNKKLDRLDAILKTMNLSPSRLNGPVLNQPNQPQSAITAPLEIGRAHV